MPQNSMMSFMDGPLMAVVAPVVVCIITDTAWLEKKLLCFSTLHNYLYSSI